MFDVGRFLEWSSVMAFGIRLRLFGRFMFFFALVSGLLSVASSQGVASTLESPALPAQGAFIQDLGDRAIGILKNKDLSAEERSDSFRSLLAATFDLETIAKFVLGRGWLAATPAQKTEYLRLFESLVVQTYSDRFSLYTGEGFKVKSVTPEGTKDFIVNSEITRPDGTKQATVTWRVRQKNDKMGIIDVVVEGVSMSVTQRQEYASIIERNGGDLEALLVMMRARVDSEAKKG